MKEVACLAFEQARAAGVKLGSHRALWPILLSQAEFACRRDDDGTAAALCQEARQIVDEIAAHIADAFDRRVRFLGCCITVSKVHSSFTCGSRVHFTHGSVVPGTSPIEHMTPQYRQVPGT